MRGFIPRITSNLDAVDARLHAVSGKSRGPYRAGFESIRDDSRSLRKTMKDSSADLERTEAFLRSLNIIQLQMEING